MQYIFPGNNVSSCAMFEVVLCLGAPLMTSYIYLKESEETEPEEVSENETEEPEEESEVTFFLLH